MNFQLTATYLYIDILVLAIPTCFPSDQTAQTTTVLFISYFINFNDFMYIYILMFYYTVLFKMIVGVLTTCHTQYT
jgi:hypothetical protein